MPKLLTADQVTGYRRDGFHFPVRVLPAAEARAYRDRLEEQERALGGPLTGDMRHKVHLLFTWANELARHPKILDAVEDVIGPDILCWSTTFFTKEANSPSFVSWHQDATYWGLNTTADRRIGYAIRYIPTHVRQLKVRDSATLVRGRDRHGNFDLEPEPRADLDAAALAAHRDAVERSAKALYAGTDRTQFRA